MKYYGIQNEVKAYINRLQAENGIIVSPSTVKTINDRVESLKRSGDWSRFSLGFNDTDGDAYLARAGVTNPLGRCEVLWFTRGVKALGLWQNMVAWSLRDYQNAGTGSTVYSLGGLGVFNGTMVNSPTWGSGGLLVRGDNYFSTVSLTPLSIVYCGNNNNTLGASARRLTNSNLICVNSNAWCLRKGGDGTIAIDSAISTLPVGFWGARIAANDAELFVNGSNIGIDNSYNSYGSNTFWLSDGSNGIVGTCSLIASFSLGLSLSQYLTVRALYKSTLGSNLGLP